MGAQEEMSSGEVLVAVLTTSGTSPRQWDRILWPAVWPSGTSFIAAATWVSNQLKQNAVIVVSSERPSPAAANPNAAGNAIGSGWLEAVVEATQFRVFASCSSDPPICSVSRRNSDDSRLARNQEFQ